MSKDGEYDALSDWYDILWPDVDDLPLYRRLANKHSSSFLELGCGTGRLACELAKSGYPTIGIDLSTKMLERANARKATLDLEAQSLVDFKLQDMTSFVLERQFDFIIAPFSTMLEVISTEDRTATYQSSLRHLSDNGALVVDNWFRGSGHLADWGKPRPHGIVTFIGGRQHPAKADIQIQHFEVQTYQPDGIMELIILVDEITPGGGVRRRTFNLTRCYVSPDQTHEELTRAGFRQIEVNGGFNLESMYDPALRGRGRQIFIARR